MKRDWSQPVPQQVTVITHDEVLAENMAFVLGPSSAAAACLRELYARRERGEAVDVWLRGKTWVVGPAGKPPKDAA